MDIHLPIAEVAASIYHLLTMGVIAGINSGLFGLGANFILIPALIIMGIPADIALSSAIASALAPGLVSALQAWSDDKVDFKILGWIILGSALGIAFGSYIISLLARTSSLESFIPIFHFIVLSIISLATLSTVIKKKIFYQDALNPRANFLIQGLRGMPFQKHFSHANTQASVLLLILCGMLGGLMSSISGIGAGFLLLPILAHIVNLNIIRAIAITAWSTVIILSATTFIHAANFYTVDITLAVIMSLAGIFSVRIGKFIQPKLSSDSLNLLFGCITLLIAIKLALQLTLEPTSKFSISVVRH